MRRYVVVAVLLVFSVAVFSAGEEPKGPTVVVRVNCGDDKDYTDETGAQWSADQVYGEGRTWGAIGGNTVHRDNPKVIKGSKCQEVDLTERYGMTAYRFDLPNGKYIVRLRFCETHGDSYRSGRRIQTVSLNGKVVLPDFDTYDSVHAWATPVVREFKEIEVSDGKLMIEFAKKVNNTSINGIEIFK
jgi:beta-galactosidase